MTARTIVPVPKQVHALIWRLIDGWRPERLNPGRLGSAQWGREDVSARVGETTIEIPNILVEVGGIALGDTDHLWNVPLKGAFGDGSVLDAEQSFPSGNHAKSRYWTIEDKTRRACLWVGRITGKLSDAQRPFEGNLSTREVVETGDGQRSGRLDHSHLRLQGRHKYYLVRASTKTLEWFLIVDTYDRAPPRREDLYPDFLALQFVLGRGLKLEAFFGVDEAGTTVGMVGGVYGRDQGEDAVVFPPVPHSWQTPATWAAPFFAAISKAYAENEVAATKDKDRNIRLYIPVSGYVESLAEAHVEGRCLRLHVALEGFAFWVCKVKATKEEREVAEGLSTRWESWVTEHEPELRKLVRGPALAEQPEEGEDEGEAANIVVAKVRSAIMPASTQSVPAAYAEYGVALPGEMKKRLSKVRGKLVHTAVLFAERQDDIDAYLEPIALVRTLLVGLLAKVVGYEGEVVGWEKQKHRDYETAPSSWWPTSNACRAEAMINYVADIGDVEGYARSGHAGTGGAAPG
jgi:hypothetical protein